MPETPHQYTKRMLANVEGKNALRVQESTPGKISKIIKGFDRKHLARRPAPDRWSIAEILAHLADAELVLGWRLRVILAGNGSSIQPFDQNVWAATFRYGRRDPRASLETFHVLRKNNLNLLKSVPKKLWENYGMHQERGKEPIAHIIRMMAGHDLNHLRQIEEIASQKRTTRAKRG